MLTRLIGSIVFAMYTNIESSCWTCEINIMLYVHYTSRKKKRLLKLLNVKSPRTKLKSVETAFLFCLLRNLGETAQDPLYRWLSPFHMYWSKSITFDCRAYCLGLSNRRKFPEGEIHILFAHYHSSPEKPSFLSFIACTCLPLGEKVKLRNLRCIHFSLAIIFDTVQSITCKRLQNIND